MGSPSPRTVQDYCHSFNLPLDSVRLPCLFCGNYCCTEDLLQCMLKNFCLVWKGPFCYAACTPCVYASAKHEYRNYFQCFVKGPAVEHLAQKSLFLLHVRCIHCLKELDDAEKAGHLAKHIDFALVRGNWRGFCRECLSAIF